MVRELKVELVNVVFSVLDDYDFCLVKESPHKYL